MLASVSRGARAPKWPMSELAMIGEDLGHAPAGVEGCRRKTMTDRVRTLRTFTTALFLLRSGAGAKNRAGEEIRPIALEERSLRPVASADGPRVASESIAFESHQDLYGAILDTLGTESKFRKRPGPGERDLVSIRAAYGPRPPASPASLNVKRKRGEHGFRNDRHLAPLQRPGSFVSPLERRRPAGGSLR